MDTVEDYETYEDYLDSQVTKTDMHYLQDEDIAWQLVELGYRGSGDTLQRQCSPLTFQNKRCIDYVLFYPFEPAAATDTTREEFEARKRALLERSNQKTNVPKQLSSAGKAVPVLKSLSPLPHRSPRRPGKDLSASPFLLALGNREELVRNGKLTCVIFVRDVNSKGHEVSGYIDYAHRLRSTNFEPYFERRKKVVEMDLRRIMPRPTDLSYYNWETQTSTSNSTPNFQVIADGKEGLLFKNKRDRKVINVDPNAAPGDNTARTEIRTPEYRQVVIYDHMTRRKS